MHRFAALQNFEIISWGKAKAMLAMAPPVQPGQKPPPLWTSLVPMGLILVVFYFVLIYPQQKKAKEHTALLKTLKAGDRVCSNGGIIGTVLSVKDRSVTIRSGDSKLEILKSAVTDILERGSSSSEA